MSITFIVYVNGKRFCVCNEKEQADRIASFYNGSIEKRSVLSPLEQITQKINSSQRV